MYNKAVRADNGNDITDLTKRSKFNNGKTFCNEEGFLWACNQSFGAQPDPPLVGVTAGSAVGLIPSIHLQRHCQLMQAGRRYSSKGKGGGGGYGRREEREKGKA